MRTYTQLLILPAVVALAVAGCDRVTQAGGDHGHAATAHDHEAGHGGDLDPISVTLFTPRVLLFMQYPHLTKGP